MACSPPHLSSNEHTLYSALPPHTHGFLSQLKKKKKHNKNKIKLVGVTSMQPGTEQELELRSFFYKKKKDAANWFVSSPFSDDMVDVSAAHSQTWVELKIWC